MIPADSVQSPDVRSFQMKNSRYLLLRLKIVFMLFYKRKLSIKKIINVMGCYLSYYLKSEKSARYPFTISFELSNECNANCLFCRTERGEIYNQNPAGSAFIEKGKMSFELFTQVIDEVKNHMLMAILYVNGEPLIYKRLSDAVEYASRNNLATMIATNGILLTEKNIDHLLSAGLDFIKVAVSGFTQSTYSRQNRHGDIDKIKQNLRMLKVANDRLGSRSIIMIDFIYYDYNEAEIFPAKAFFEDLGFMFNLRKGNVSHMEGVVPATVLPTTESLPVCDWPWKILTINWNGDVFPCCDYVVWSGMSAYRRLTTGDVDIAEIWNGPKARVYRKIHCSEGRSAIPICTDCKRSSVTFKY